MRVKHLWAVVPGPSKLKLMWDRITYSRMTTFYFIFSVIHCFIQVSLQIRAFDINAEAAETLFEITKQGNATNQGFPVLGKDLRICDHVPRNMSASSCRVVWDGTPGTENAWTTMLNGATSPAPTTPTSSSSLLALPSASPPGLSLFESPPTTVSDPPKRTVTVFTRLATTPTKPTAVVTSSSRVIPHVGRHNDFIKRDGLDNVHVQAVDVDGTTQVIVNGPGFRKTAVLEKSCIWVLNYPVEILQNTKREDIVFIAFQFWVLGMSIVAILNESIPHIIASLLTHMLATAWAGFQISHTASFRRDFIRVTMEGACKASPNDGSMPINLLPLYWAQRRGAELPSLILNVVALFVSAFLTWKLVKSFGWQTFKRVGASLTIQRIYKIVLVLSITIQLGLFFMVVTVGLWIDQLYNGSIGRYAVLSSVYKVAFIITLILMVPWLMMGWFSVRRELKITMMIFLVLCICYLVGYGVMFVSDTFRWTFVQWRFFSLMAMGSVVLNVLAFILGVICRVNFGKGLRSYLNAEEPLPGDDFEPAFPNRDVEKIDFPSNEKTLPMFTTTFDTPPSQVQYPSYATAWRYGQDAREIEPQAQVYVTPPPPVHTRFPSDSTVTVSRHDSRASKRSQKSYNSSQASTLTRTGSKSSQSSSDSTNRIMNGKRWVIE